MEDNCATYKGGECGGCFAAAFGGKGDDLRWRCSPVPDNLAARAKLFGCTAGPEPVGNTAPVHCQRWSGCRDNTTVTLCSLEGHGHSWPGGKGMPICERRPNMPLCQKKEERSGPALGNVNAAAMIVDFFQATK